MLFNPGDSVIINSKGSSIYQFTKEGSTGIVLECTDTYVTIQFDYLTGRVRDPYKQQTWEVDIDTVELLDSTIDMSHPNYKVISKVNQMYRRRKELGYAF